MPNITNLRKTIGGYLGQALTPEMAAEIEVSALDYQPAPDCSYAPEQFGVQTHGDFVIRVERMSDILAELHLLHLEHWQETEGYRHGLAMNPDYEAMMADERAGRMVQFTVRQNGLLVGNLRMYVHVSRHTKTLMAQEDTLFISKHSRGTFLAIALLKFMEKALSSVGVREFEGDSKLINNADVLLRRMKYEPVAIKFAKVLKERIHV